ncbi:MAG: hypothetical protein CL845_07270 [Crocinitomicaceae bacterium]|nr:hypothetical protein [Crocinitomicaceae bacterium]
MRIAILLLSALFAIGDTCCQITITGDDMPQPNVTYPMVNAVMTDMNLSEISGANVVWDASDLMALMEVPRTPVDINNASISAALVFNSPFNSAYQCDFFLPTGLPDLGADLGIPIDGFNNFYQTQGDAYAIAGIGLSAMGFDLPVTYDDIDEILPLPMAYGETMSSTATFELDLTGIFTYALTQSREVEADGWGTLILPTGSYDVLRTRTELTATDDVLIAQIGEPFTIDREQVTFQWWGAGMGFPLLEITEVFGLPLTVTFQDLGESNNVADCSLSGGFRPFPNPVQRGQKIQWTTPTQWSLTDGSGRTLASSQSNTMTIPIDIGSGLYILRTDEGKIARILVQ